MKKIKIFTLLLCASLLALSFSGIVNANQNEEQEFLPIHINHYLGGIAYKTTTKELATSDYLDVTTLLTDLQDALCTQNQQQIQSLTQQLKDYDIDIQNTLPNPTTLRAPQNTNYLPTDINNSFCYFHAAGTGNIVFALGVIVWEWLTSQITNFSSAIELIILLMISAPFWVPILIINHLIPFRIMMLKSAVTINDGKITTIGTQGIKQEHITAPDQASVDLRFFTGITLTIPRFNSEQEAEDPFIFVSGIAGSATNI